MKKFVLLLALVAVSATPPAITPAKATGATYDFDNNGGGGTYYPRTYWEKVKLWWYEL